MQNSHSLEQAKLCFINGLEKLNLNNFAGAENDFQTSLRFAPNRLSVLINLSIVQIKLKKYEDAEKLICESLILYPNNNELLMGLVEVYENLIAIDPNLTEVYFNLGNTFRALGMYEESLRSYDHIKAISIDSSHTKAILNRDSVLKEIKELNVEFSSNMHSNMMSHNLAGNYLDHGNILKNLKRLDESIASYDRAIEIDPCFAQAYSNRGIALRELNRLQEAIASYNKAIEINPVYAEAFSNRGIALRELKK